MGRFVKHPIIIGLALMMGVVSCAREPQYSPIPIGKKMVIMPAAVNSTSFAKPATVEPKAVHLTISWTGLNLSARPRDTLIKFYKSKDKNPYYEAKWSELKLAYKLSNCGNEQIAQLDGPLDAVLICDGRLGPVEQIGEVELLELPEGRSVRTSSLNTYQRPDEVLSLMIQAY